MPGDHHQKQIIGSSTFSHGSKNCSGLVFFLFFVCRNKIENSEIFVFHALNCFVLVVFHLSNIYRIRCIFLYFKSRKLLTIDRPFLSNIFYTIHAQKTSLLLPDMRSRRTTFLTLSHTVKKITHSQQKRSHTLKKEKP